MMMMLRWYIDMHLTPCLDGRFLSHPYNLRDNRAARDSDVRVLPGPALLPRPCISISTSISISVSISINGSGTEDTTE